MAGVIKEEVERKLARLPGVKEVSVEVVFDPPWEPSRMSEAAKLQLGLDLGFRRQNPNPTHRCCRSGSRAVSHCRDHETAELCSSCRAGLQLLAGRGADHIHDSHQPQRLAHRELASEDAVDHVGRHVGDFLQRRAGERVCPGSPPAPWPRCPADSPPRSSTSACRRGPLPTRRMPPIHSRERGAPPDRAAGRCAPAPA